MRSSTCGQIEEGWPSPAAFPASSPVAAASSDMSSTGTMTCSSIRLSEAGWTMSTSWLPPNRAATSCTGRTVADRPIRRAGRGRSMSSRSRLTARCAPRLVPATACTSSTITVSTLRSDSRAADVSRRNSDSGVVMRMSGGRVTSRRRSGAGVSPVRIPTVTSGVASPRRAAACRMPTSGARRLRSTSTASALSGDMYSTRQRWRGSAGGSAAYRRSRDHKKAARVLPDPVGATTSASRPDVAAAQAPTWAAVGSAKAPVNHARVAGVNAARGSFAIEGILSRTTDARRPPPLPGGPAAAVSPPVPVASRRAADGVLAADGRAFRRGLRPVLGAGHRSVRARRANCRRRAGPGRAGQGRVARRRRAPWPAGCPALTPRLRSARQCVGSADRISSSTVCSETGR